MFFHLIRKVIFASIFIAFGNDHLDSSSSFKATIPSFFYNSLCISDCFIKNKNSEELRMVFDAVKNGDSTIDVRLLDAAILELKNFFEDMPQTDPILLNAKNDFNSELDNLSSCDDPEAMIYRGGNKNFKSVTCSRLSASSVQSSGDVMIGGNLSIAGSIVSRLRLHSLPASSILATAANKVLTAISYSTDSLPGSVVIRDAAGRFKVSNPTESGHVATKEYVDSVVESLNIKKPVRVLSASNVSLDSLYTLNGVALASGDRVLLVGQSDQKQNGIWVAGLGAWARPDDFEDGAGAKSVFVFVQEGLTYADTGWICTNNSGADVIGVSDLLFSQFSSRDSFSISNVGAGEGQVYKDFSSGTYNFRTLTSSNDHLSISVLGNEIVFDLGATDQNTPQTLVARNETGGFSGGVVDFESLTLGSPLAVSNGGTGVATLNQNSILIGNGESPMSSIPVGVSGTVLVGNTDAAPSFSNNPTLRGVNFGAGDFKTVGGAVTLSASGTTSINLPTSGSLTTGYFFESGSQNLKIICGEGRMTIAESAFSGTVSIDISSIGFNVSYVAYIGSKTDINGASSIGRSVIYDYSGSTNSSLKINASIGASPGAPFDLNFGYILVGY